MTRVTFDGVDVERCMDCHGLFIDEAAKETLRHTRGADVIDSGDPRTGREFNEVDCIRCPRCDSPMIRMVDRQQPHIWFERCTVCGGSFLDAGEFRDLSHRTLLDIFKDWFTPERR
jgi:Zn-finger nucleic acid-binding protein